MVDDGRTTDGRTDGRTTEHGYTISSPCEPDGSGELINKLQRRSCKLILSQDYCRLEESLKRLDILSFDQSVFLNKAKVRYKVHNNIAPSYLQEL